MKGNILKKQNGDWNFKDIFLETLDQDRYGIARRNDDNENKERGIYKTAKNYSSEDKRMMVVLTQAMKALKGRKYKNLLK